MKYKSGWKKYCNNDSALRLVTTIFSSMKSFVYFEFVFSCFQINTKVADEKIWNFTEPAAVFFTWKIEMRIRKYLVSWWIVCPFLLKWKLARKFSPIFFWFVEWVLAWIPFFFARLGHEHVHTYEQDKIVEKATRFLKIPSINSIYLSLLKKFLALVLPKSQDMPLKIFRFLELARKAVVFNWCTCPSN